MSPQKEMRRNHKLGANRNEFANKQKKLKPGFSQSRDIREDRGTRQTKLAKRR